MAHQDRTYDVVLLGATGFVGRLTAEHLARSAPDGTRIALAGRSRERLDELRERLDVDWPAEEVDVTDAAALRRLAESTAVLATTVGPYLRHGIPVVEACAQAGTSYTDLSGESAFVAQSIRRADDIARGTGARIVHSCGFDSVPSDLGVGLAHAAAGSVPLVEAHVQVRSIRGGISGGTIDSLRQQLVAARSDRAVRRIVADPFSLTPGPAVRLPRSSTPGGVRRDTAGTWQAPFVMGSYNQQIVQRSSFLTGWAYGQLMRYREVVDTAAGLAGRLVASGVAAAGDALVAGLMFGPTRALLDRILPSPGEGPSERTMARGGFSIDVDVYPVTGAPVRTRFGAPLDPGYRGTAVMLGESALSLALDDLPERAGVLTPMVAMGEALAERLRHHRFTVKTSPLVPEGE